MRTRTLQLALTVSAILCIVASIVLWYGLYEVGQKTVSIEEFAVRIKQEHLKIDQSQALKRLASTTVEARTRLDDAFLKSDDVASFAGFLERLGSSVGATTKITAYSTGPNSDALFNTENLKTSLAVSGSWSAVINTVRLLEHLPYVSAIETVSYTKGVSEEAGKVARNAPWTANVTLRVLKYKQ